MEIEEIRNYWKKENKRITEHVRVNKQSAQKLRSAYKRIKIKRLTALLLPLIYLPPIFAFILIPHVKNDGSFGFYLSFTFLAVAIMGTYVVNTYYYARLFKLDYTRPVLQMQKEILRLETIDKRFHRTAYLLVPFVFLAFLRIFGLLQPNRTALLLLLLSIVFIITGYFVKTKRILPNEYRQVKSYLAEMEETEKE